VSAALVHDIYRRVSGGKQEKHGASLDDQEKDARALVAASGGVVRHVFTDVFTGVELWDRPDLQRMRDTWRRDPPDVVVVDVLDRLARETDHQIVLLSEAEYYGVAVTFTHESYDDTEEGKLVRYARGYAAKVEHTKIKERTQRGLRTRIAAGKPLPGARVLYGYAWNEERTAYVFDGPKASVVRRVYREFLAGGTLRGIAAGLTASGIPTATGKPIWVYTVVSKILQNPRYMGVAVANRYKSVRVKGSTSGRRVKRHVSLRPVEEHVPLPEGTIPALVTADEYAAVAAMLATNKASAARNNPEPEAYLLRAGHVRCGYCGKTMSGVRMANGLRIYRCTRASDTGCYQGIAAHLLDQAVWARLRAALSDPERLAAELEQRAADDPSEPDLAVIDREAAEVERQLGNLTVRLGLVADEHVAGLVATQMSQLAERGRWLGAQRAAVLGRHATALAARGRVLGLTVWCRRLGRRLDELGYAEKRVAVEAFGVEVRVWRADHAPRWTLTASVPDVGGAEIVYPTAARSVHNTAATHVLTLRWSADDAQARVG
jgi:site-specific DNA recombinase